MSTRATYQIDGRDFRPRVTLYIHHDGYLEGAACYFYQAFIAGNGRIDAESMIRGNLKAEITGSHDTHGDTEYRYTLDRDGKLKAEHRIDFGTSEAPAWKMVFYGDVAEFINQHANPQWLDNFQPIRKLKIGYTESYWTPAMLQKRYNEQIALYGQWSLGAYKGKPDAANMQAIQREIEAIEAAISMFGAPSWKAEAA